MAASTFFSPSPLFFGGGGGGQNKVLSFSPFNVDVHQHPCFQKGFQTDTFAFRDDPPPEILIYTV